MNATTTISDKLKLAQLFVSRGTLSSLRRFSLNPLARWRLSGPVAAELLVAPQDLSTADPTLATDIYAGYFSLNGHTVNCGGISPFEMTGMPAAWERALHEFGWLKHLRAAETSVARTQARLLVDDWIRLNGSVRSGSWDVERTAKRIIAWLSHSPLLLEGCDHPFYRRFMRSLTRQVRFLRLMAKDAPTGMPRLYVAIALSYAAISMSGHHSFVKNSTKRLDRELLTQILPDGGHISRNPSAVIKTLALLMPLRQAIIARDVVPSDVLIGAIDRLMPMLRFFRLGDGGFGKFNGMGDTPGDLVATMLAHDDVGGAPILNAPHSGYQRLVGGNVVVLMDTGGLPPQSLSGSMHAGCLSFEMSAGMERIVVNCGHLDSDYSEPDGAMLAKIGRSTAAHSTLSINEESSCRFLSSDRLYQLIGTPVLSGPDKVDMKRSSQEATVTLDATHDGYIRPFGLKHKRMLTLTADGMVLSGQDVVLTSRDKQVASDNANSFQIRFHLHPYVKASLSSSRTVEITLQSGKRWLFSCLNVDIALDDTVSFSSIYGTKPAQQIVVQGLLGENSVVDWAFQQLS